MPELLHGVGRAGKSISGTTRDDPLGHHDPGFTLGTYVHLLDEGLGDAEFLDTALNGHSPTPATTVATALPTHDE